MDEKIEGNSCRSEVKSYSKYRNRIPGIVENIIAGFNECKAINHIDYQQIPSRDSVIELIDRLRDILFPGYFNKAKLEPVNLNYYIGQSVSTLFDTLSNQISLSIRHDCFRYNQQCTECGELGCEIALSFMESIPLIQKMLAKDVEAAYEGDPAAKSLDEIIFSYPGVFAIMVYRVAHKLFEMNVPLIPRIMTEHAHCVTGIDIHPGAVIGERFVIDHGTGVVIGETSEIGNNVRIYQGVTLGALSLSKDECEKIRGKKRHPTIKNDVVIYAGATILGGNTVIGDRSVIGGNVWITESVPPDTKVVMETPQLIYR